MGVIIPLGYGQANVRWSLVGGSGVAVSTFGVDVDITVAASTNAAAIDTLIKAANNPCSASQFSSGWVYNDITLTQMGTTGPEVGVATSNLTGSGSLSTCPLNTAFLLRKNTARGGRKGKGRSYLPPIWISENNVDSAGVIAGTNLTAANVLWANFLTALVGASKPAVLLHSDGSAPDAITSWFIESVVATQRRRLRR